MNRIDRKFRELRARKKKAFIAFLTAGYPDLPTTLQLVLACERGGADIVELGIPFSDPMADGPVIQFSSQEALRKGVTPAKIFDLVSAVRMKSRIPLCLMTYYNPVFAYGRERFLKKAHTLGVDGVIIPDLPPEEDKEFVRYAHRYGIAPVCFIAPTTTRERMAYIARRSRGFIYYVSLTGVTGARKHLPADLQKQLSAVKRITDRPVCVGFGVSRPEQVRRLCRAADGVIVGSAIINKIRQSRSKKTMIKAVEDYVRKLQYVPQDHIR